jgi:hypothetical protein
VKKILTAVLCLALPGLFFLNAWQGFRTSMMADRVADLERQQAELLSANRDVIGQIAYETSPERVAQKAARLGLVPGGEGADGAGLGADAAGSGIAVTRLRVGPDAGGEPAP